MNLKHYLTVFIKVMHQRNEYLNTVFTNKLVNDHRIRKNPSEDISKKDREKLLNLIGKDHFFRNAENSNRQSIRHYLHKLNVSLKFLNKKSKKIKNIAQQMSDHSYGMKETTYKILDIAENKYNIFLNLEKNIQKQAKLLEHGQDIFKEYMELIKEQEIYEEELIKFKPREKELFHELYGKHKIIADEIQRILNDKNITNAKSKTRYEKIASICLMNIVVMATVALFSTSGMSPYGSLNEIEIQFLNKVASTGVIASLGGLATLGISKIIEEFIFLEK